MRGFGLVFKEEGEGKKVCSLAWTVLDAEFGGEEEFGRF